MLGYKALAEFASMEEVNADIAKKRLTDAEVEALIQQRTEARKAKDFKTADAIRDKLKEMGITLIDTKEGVKIVKE